MPTIVPESGNESGKGGLAEQLGESLESLLEFTGANAGWVGLTQKDGQLDFPAIRGQIADSWLHFQRSGDAAWGFAIREGPTILNDLCPMPLLGQPLLRNLLSCPLLDRECPVGHVVLANKANGFSSHDASVLQGMAHLMNRRLVRLKKTHEPPALALSSILALILDDMDQGLVVLDKAGRIVHASAVFLKWTGFSAEELLGRMPPFPFWISHRILGITTRQMESHPSSAGTTPSDLESHGPLPFRRRDDSVFWCHAQARAVEVQGRGLLIVRYRPATFESKTPGQAHTKDPTKSIMEGLPNGLPFPAALIDQTGRVLWGNQSFATQIARGRPLDGRLLREFFPASAVATLDRFLHRSPEEEDACLGRLLLAHTDAAGALRPLIAYWVAVGAAPLPRFLLAFSEDWQTLGEMAEFSQENSWHQVRPATHSLMLRVWPGQEIAYWDSRWEKLTGLTQSDLAGVPSEVVLDWIFPRQGDRDVVADILHQPAAQGRQAMLQFVTPTGSRPLLSTWLPVNGQQGPHWIVLVNEPEQFPEAGPPSVHVGRSFLRGLSQLLNHHLLKPVGIAEQAVELGDLPPETAAAFEHILESCQRTSQLLDAFQDLAAVTPSDLREVSLADLIREFVKEQGKRPALKNYDLALDLPANGSVVRGNPRMLKKIIRHLYDNAEQSLTKQGTRRIGIRVSSQGEDLVCAITDTGEGLPTDDWSLLLAPFASTKGAFARDALHAAVEATGLGLTVGQHLLGLHGGRLELRNQPQGGTMALFYLPRVEFPTSGPSPSTRERETIRTDLPAGARGPHPTTESAPPVESFPPQTGS